MNNQTGQDRKTMSLLQYVLQYLEKFYDEFINTQEIC